MAKFINPNQRAVTIDLGNPTRRHITIEPFASKPRPGAVRVVEMDGRKAAQFMQMGMLFPADETKTPVADLDAIALEAQATEAAVARFNRAPTPDRKAELDARRKRTEAEFRAQEAAALNEAAARQRAIDSTAQARQAREDAKRGLNPNPPAPALVARQADPDAETRDELDPVVDADAENKGAGTDPEAENKGAATGDAPKAPELTNGQAKPQDSKGKGDGSVGRTSDTK